MLISLGLLISLVVAAVAVAAYTLLAQRRRQAILGRAVADVARPLPSRSPFLSPSRARRERLGADVAGRLRVMSWLDDARAHEKLVQAGFDDPAAPIVYTTVRLAVLIALPVLGLVWVPWSAGSQMILLVAGMLAFGWSLPVVMLDRLVRLRQERMRRGIPDALDLLVVCIEAGVSLDAAILRVAREMALPYPELSRELMVINRKTNAGMPRDEALRGLWPRTGLEELRSLASSIIQSERWGTSITKVLRVSAEALRRRRRQAAERRMAQAPVKMTIPLVVMILPALFIVIMGPALLQIMRSLGEWGR